MRRTDPIVWHGTEQETIELLAVVASHCQCQTSSGGGLVTTCGPHDLLFRDQRGLDGLLFARHLRERLQVEEFSSLH